MTFSRQNPAGWAAFEILTSAQANGIDINQSRAVDGYAGGTYNPSAALVWNEEATFDASGVVAANATGVTGVGKGTEPGGDFAGGSSGSGVVAVAGAAGGDPGGDFTGSTANGHGVLGTGQGSGQGVRGVGGAGGGEGVRGIGGGATAGVYGQGGSGGGTGVEGHGVAGGHGVEGYGQGAGEGGVFQGGASDGHGVTADGGATNGYGVVGTGAGLGAGVKGTGGGTDANGVEGVGGATNGNGGAFQGTGTGSAVHTVRTAGGPNISMQGAAADPTSLSDGDLWYEATNAEFLVRANTHKFQLLDTWCSATITGGGAPAMGDNNNVSSVTSNATQITVTFQRNFANTTYAVYIGVLVAGASWFGVYKSKAVGTMSFSLYDDAGNLIVPNAGGTNCEISVMVKGYM